MYVVNPPSYCFTLRSAACDAGRNQRPPPVAESSAMLGHLRASLLRSVPSVAGVLAIAALLYPLLVYAANLDWDTEDWTQGSNGPASYPLGNGNVTITFSGPGTGFWVNNAPDDTTQLTVPAGGESLFMSVNYAAFCNGSIAAPNCYVDVTMDFDHPNGVSDIGFQFYDIDNGGGFVDTLTVTAVNGPTINPSTITPSNISNTLAPVPDDVNTIIGTAGAASGSADGNATFVFNQRNITQVTIRYGNTLNNNATNQWAAFSAIGFTSMPDLTNSTKVATPASSPPPQVAPGETITYTITVVNDGEQDAQNVRVIDDIPADVNSFTVTGTPGGSTDSSLPSGGANGTGFLDINGFTVAAGTSETITYTVVVDDPVAIGTTFDNTATISADETTDVQVSASTLAVPPPDLSTSTKVGTPQTTSPPGVTAGELVTYQIDVINTSITDATNVRVLDTIPTDTNTLTITGFPGVTYTDDSTATVVDINSFTVAAGTTETITYTVLVDSPLAGGTDIDNSVAITADDGVNETINAPTLTVGVADISTSTKTVTTAGGGTNVGPLEQVTYTITINNTGSVSASGVQVTDDIPADLTNFIVTSIPSGATDSSTGAGTGAFGSGYLDISGFSVAAGGSETIQFVAQVDAAALNGATITNDADIAVPAQLLNQNVVATTLTVNTSLPGGFLKQLYISHALTPNFMYRVVPTGVDFVAVGGGASNSYLLYTDAALSTAMPRATTISAGTNSVQVNLILVRFGGPANQSVTATLACTGCGGASPLLNATQTVNIPAGVGGATLVTWGATLGANVTLNAGATLTLTFTRNTAGGTVYVVNALGGNTSTVDLRILDPIQVDSITAYDAPQPGGAVATQFDMGDTVYLRAVVSDPFGSYDVNANDPATQPTITITDADSGVVVSNVAMGTEFLETTAAGTKEFEYAYAIPNPGAPSPGPTAGTYDVSVTAQEGTEGTVFDTGVGSFDLVKPDIVVTKSETVLSDPVGANTYHVPGSVVRYTITVTNDGDGSPDLDAVTITETIPAGVELFVGTGADCTAGPVVSFVPGSSGLAFDCTTDLSFTPGSPYPSASDYASAGSISSITLTPTGTFATGGASFSFSFDVRIP